MPITVQAGLRVRKLALHSNRSYGYAFRSRAALTNTSPHVLPGGEMIAPRFESTKDFAQSEIHKVIPLLRKILCDKSVGNGFGPQSDPEGVKYRDVFHQSKSLRDHLAPW